jgi:hypothetical protein
MIQECGIQKITENDDPCRCQATNKFGQCTNKAVPGGTVCLVHGGNKQMESQVKASKNIYYLGKWQNRVEEHASHDLVKSLREEIGILRVLLETRFRTCHDEMDLILQSQPIAELVSKIEKVVTSCNKLESHLGHHLDKQQILVFATQIINIVSNYVEDPNIIETIGEEILTSIDGESSTSEYSA